MDEKKPAFASGLMAFVIGVILVIIIVGVVWAQLNDFVVTPGEFVDSGPTSEFEFGTDHYVSLVVVFVVLGFGVFSWWDPWEWFHEV